MTAPFRSRLAAAGVGVWALAAASCGGGGGGGGGGALPSTGATPTPAVSSPAATPSPTPAPTTSPTTPTPTPRMAQASIYLMHDGTVAPAHRSVNAVTPARGAILALIAAPGAERDAGLRNDVPATTRLLGIGISNGVATVDLSREFAEGSSDSLARRTAQVVYTLTQFATVRSVTLHIEGSAVSSLGGVSLAHPVTRADFEQWTPAVLIESPAAGDTVSSPLHVWGTANTFEAVFHLSLVTAGGVIVFDEVEQATSGTGTRGSFDVTVSYGFTGTGDATLSGYEISMRDGTPIHVSTTHVVLGR